MNRIDPRLVKSIAILLNGSSRRIGTAFIALYSELVSDQIFQSYYLITCQHCVAGLVTARFHNGLLLQIQSAEWSVPTSHDDVVALDITKIINGPHPDIGSVSVKSLVDRQGSYFNIGADLFMLGLLVDEQDIGVNLPRARFGNLSAFADDRVTLEQGNGVMRPCHLGDMRSRTGFSGSPVICYQETHNLDSVVRLHEKFLGVHSAQHRERIRVFSTSSTLDAEINSSMTRIVPAWIIKELIEADSKLVALRTDRQRVPPPF